MRRAACLFLCVPALLGADSVRVQSPDAPWKTYRTAHYRIHFPAHHSFTPFAEEVASRIEGIHAKVTEWVGHEAKGPIDVVLRDPVMDANGFALPLLKRPYVELWKTPPEPTSAIGHHRGWVELLVVHELTHIHHLTWPQQSPNWRDRLANSIVGPVATKSPRWVSEGYATLIEGRITGVGRPHSAYRAAVIRQWALQGKLPNYETVSGMGGFRGGSMAYLVGSAYLEWLERRNPQQPDILKTFWKQLASRKRRDFSTSFRATFGMDPKDGYDRWCAEVTHDALELERRSRGLLREGEVFARVDGEITDLAVSPDGTKLLARVLSREKPGLRVWDLAPKSEKAEAKKADGKDEVQDRPPEFPEPKIFATVGRRNGYLPRHAWWIDANRIGFELREPNEEGVLQPRYLEANFSTRRVAPAAPPAPPQASPYGFKELEGIWNIVKTTPKGEQRLTRTLSAAWQPAPTPDGKALYYVRLTAMGCEVRKLDLSLPPLEEQPLPIPADPLAPRTILSPADEASLLPPPAASPPVTDYRVSDTHVSGSRVGYTWMPSGRGVQLGWGGNDLLGRLNWQVLAGIGEAMGPRGVTVGATWRGWALAPTVELFSSLERPSRQSFLPVSGADRERRGGALSFTYVDQGVDPALYRVSVASERMTLADSDLGLTRTLAGLQWNPVFRYSRGDHWGLWVRGEFRAAAGRSDGQNWRLGRQGLGVGLRTPGGVLALRGEVGQMKGTFTDWDRFHLGGETTSLVPTTLEWNRIEQVALPAYSQTGDRFQRWRVEFSDSIRLYLEHGRAWDTNLAKPSFQRVVGLEWPLHELIPANLAERFLGRFTFTLGIHRTLDGVMKDRTVTTFSLALRP